MIKNLRRLFQVVSLLFFFFLILKTSYPLDFSIPVNLYTRLSPFLALTLSIANRDFISLFLPAFVIMFFTIFFGRFFCGWLCPVGVTLDFFSFIFKSIKSRINKPKWKYYIFLFLVICSIFGLQLAGLVDPLSIATRSYALPFYSYFNFTFESFLDFLFQFNFTKDLVPTLSDFKFNLLKETGTPIYLYSNIIILIFLGIILLNLLSNRFWCHSLCPLGALLGLLSIRPLLLKKVNATLCNDCGKCQNNCKTMAIAKDPAKYSPQECINCFNCQEICPEGAINFTFKSKNPVILNQNKIFNRRSFLLSTFSSLIALPLFKFNFTSKIWPKNLIRPPGALIEEEFLNRCIRCGECIKVCPGNGLHPILFEAGLYEIGTPCLFPRIGYCEYNCNLCGKVCSTGAIKNLTEEEKKKVVIGTAIFDNNLCLPLSLGINCVVCEEMCPVPSKAIKFIKEKVTSQDGGQKEVLKPYVVIKECIGCGICETKCPLPGEAGIHVQPPLKTLNTEL
jgi:MauM/NapG family ferredoxin protein